MPDIWTLSPEALRGYALGLRSTTALLGEAWAQTGMVPEAEMSAIIVITRHAWEREAAIVEGFAARLDAPEAQPQPVTRERVAALAARFEPATLRTVAQPARAVQVCRDADAQCVARCTIQQDGRCGRGAPSAGHTAPVARWYQPDGGTSVHSTLRQAYDASPVAAPVPITSSEWAGMRWAWEDAETGLTLADTREEAMGYMAEQTRADEPAGAEPTPTTAEAVAESLATPAPSAQPSINTPAADTADALLTARREKAHALFLTGMKAAEIAAQIGIPEGSINAWASMRGWRKDLAALKAPEATARPMRSDSPWTEERLALLARLMPTVMHIDDVQAALNALPGLPITSSDAVRTKATKLGMHRRGEAIPDEFIAAQASRSRVPQMAAPTPQAETKATPPAHAQSRAENGGKPGTWTAERDAILRRHYPTTKDVAEILRDVNALPGPAVASTGAVMAQAQKLGLTRRQPPQIGPAIPGTPEPMSTEDKAEARERLRTGHSKGARDIVEYFGCTQEEALALVDEHRARMGKAA